MDFRGGWRVWIQVKLLLLLGTENEEGFRFDSLVGVVMIE
jgi:hypothetical protein